MKFSLYLSPILIVVLIIVYVFGCVLYIMPQDHIPYIVRVITLIGPVFVFIGMLRKRLIRIRQIRAAEEGRDKEGR